MNYRKIMRTIVKVAPIVYPMIKKAMNNRKASSTVPTGRRK
ncbi:hypothetical protein [Lysinibacillus yapensis]|nr:hypothetical protein [Lysinibacillus yapensis]